VFKTLIMQMELVDHEICTVLRTLNWKEREERERYEKEREDREQEEREREEREKEVEDELLGML
jgi:hypothetical protein